jgi:large subunit ribosomal protein L3
MVDETGSFIPVTILQIEDQKVTKVFDEEKDGYNAYQVGYFVKHEKNLTKPDLHRLRKAGVEENFARFSEFRTTEKPQHEVGATPSAEWIKDIQAVDVTGVTKGRGFQGAVKRWGASIGRMTHGSRFHRRPGSLGQCTTPGRVFKNKKQPGHMGVTRNTVKNLRVVNVDVEKNVIAVKGSIPGHRNGYVEVRSTNKK